MTILLQRLEMILLWKRILKVLLSQAALHLLESELFIIAIAFQVLHSEKIHSLYQSEPLPFINAQALQV